MKDASKTNEINSIWCNQHKKCLANACPSCKHCRICPALPLCQTRDLHRRKVVLPTSNACRIRYGICHLAGKTSSKGRDHECSRQATKIDGARQYLSYMYPHLDNSIDIYLCKRASCTVTSWKKRRCDSKCITPLKAKDGHLCPVSNSAANISKNGKTYHNEGNQAMTTSNIYVDFALGLYGLRDSKKETVETNAIQQHEEEEQQPQKSQQPLSQLLQPKQQEIRENDDTLEISINTFDGALPFSPLKRKSCGKEHQEEMRENDSSPEFSVDTFGDALDMPFSPLKRKGCESAAELRQKLFHSMLFPKSVSTVKGQKAVIMNQSIHPPSQLTDDKILIENSIQGKKNES